jgi:hypothetical protein
MLLFMLLFNNPGQWFSLFFGPSGTASPTP